jgi:hypothetical protein
MTKLIYFLNLIICFSLNVYGQSVRDIRDSVGFCWQNAEMDSFIVWLEKNKIDDSEFQ